MTALSDPRREFSVGDSGEVDGVEWRVVRGGKDGNPDDMVIELRAPEWVRVRMAVAGLLCDFHYQVEEILYPRSLGKRGGGYFSAFITRVFKNGWEHEAGLIRLERSLKNIQSPAPQLFDWQREGIFEERA